MAFISQEEINQVRSNANIVDIVSSYMPLTPKGKNFFGICPFHEDHNPSMSVSPDKQIYRCFVCGNTGNVFTFVERFLGVSFAEAVAIVGKQVGISITTGSDAKRDEKYYKEYELMDFVLKIYQNNLNAYEGKKAVAYLKERGLENPCIQEFQIGLSLNKSILHDILSLKGYEDKLLQELGLISVHQQEFLDVFQNRIMFPIHDFNGHVVGFTARCYLGDVTPKYLNTKETFLFKKGQILFNYHRAKEAIRLKKELVLVEGNMDAIRLSSQGLKNVVALMGTNLTTHQLEALKKLRVHLVLMLDNDNAGELATFTLGNILEEQNFKFSIVRLNGAKDPDEYVLKYGIEAIEENIQKSISFLDFKLEYLKKNRNLKEANDLSEYIKAVIDNLKKSSDEILKEVTLQKLANDYNISYAVLKEQLGEETSVSKNIVEKQNKIIEKRKDGYDKICEEILFYMMNELDYIRIYQTNIGVFSVQKYRMMANEILFYSSKYQKINLADFITYIEKNTLRESFMEVIQENMELELSLENMMNLVGALKGRERQREIASVKQEIRKELDVNRKLELMQKLTELKKGSGDNENT